MITRRSKGRRDSGKMKKEGLQRDTWNDSVCCVITGKNERKRARERERKDDILAGD